MVRETRILAVDLGTTRCKAAVFDEKGRQLGLATSEYGFLTDPGFRIHDGRTWTRTLRKCVRRVVSDSGSAPDLAAVTGQASSAICLDRRGDLVAPILSHTDERNLPYHLWVLEQIRGVGYAPSRILATLAWMREHQDAEYGRIAHVLDVKEYLAFLLTGEMRYDESQFRRSDIEGFEKLTGFRQERFGTPHGYWKPVGGVEESAARRFGLGKGAPVYVGPADGICGVLGSGALERGMIADVAGSTEVIASPVRKGSPLARAPFVISGTSLFYTSPPYGLAYRWLKENLFSGQDDAYARMDEAAARVAPGSDGLLYIPHVTTTGYVSRLSGNFIGLGPRHTRDQMARAMMEGLTFGFYEKLLTGGKEGLRVRSIVSSGGAAYSSTWNQIKADVVDCEVHVPRVLETTCLGAAILAATAYGVHGDVRGAVRAMVGVAHTVKPRRETVDFYRRLWERYRGVRAGLLAGQPSQRASPLE